MADLRHRILSDNLLYIRSLLVTPYKIMRHNGLLFLLLYILRLIRWHYLTFRIRRLYFGSHGKPVQNTSEEELSTRDIVSHGTQLISTLMERYSNLYLDREDIRVLINTPKEGNAQYFYFQDLAQCLCHTGIKVHLYTASTDDLEAALNDFHPTVFITGDSAFGFGLPRSCEVALRQYKGRHGLVRLYLPFYASPLRVSPPSQPLLNRIASHRNGELADAFIGYFEDVFWNHFCRPWHASGLNYYSLPFAANPCRHYPLLRRKEYDWGIATANGDVGERAALTLRYMARIIDKHHGVIAGYNWGKGTAPVPLSRIAEFFSRVRISPNLANAANVSFPLDCGAKVHELSAMGVFQLSTETEALRKYYSPTEVVGFRSKAEFDALFEYFLDKPQVRQMYVKNGMTRTLAENTYFQRIDSLVLLLDTHPELFGASWRSTAFSARGLVRN
jgi:hypothetical protein